MLKYFLAAMVSAGFFLVACGQGADSFYARKNGAKEGSRSEGEKPAPPAKVVEKVQALQLQAPTQNEADFLNSMEMELKGGDRAFFSFSYSPAKAGSLYFSLAQVKFHLNKCSQEEARKAQIKVAWQEVRGNGRKLLALLEGSIQEFKFEAGKTYYLSYVLMDLKEFADCESATLKFAVFPKNYTEGL